MNDEPELPEQVKNLPVTVDGGPGTLSLQEAIQLAHFHLHGDIPFL